MKKIKAIILSGDHGAGKSTMANEIITKLEWVKLIPQYTSRKPRNDGQETENYFVSVKEVEKCDIVGAYKDGDGSMFKIGYSLYDIRYALARNCSPLLIGHKAIIEQLRSMLPRSSTLEIFLECNKNIAAQKIVEHGGSSPEQVRARLERGWTSTFDVNYTDYVVKNMYDDSSKNAVLNIIRTAGLPAHNINLQRELSFNDPLEVMA